MRLWIGRTRQKQRFQQNKNEAIFVVKTSTGTNGGIAKSVNMDFKENSISILIIEDSYGDQILLESMLERTNLPISKITMASTIAEGISYLEKETFSLIFLDFFLPDSNGLESYTELYRSNAKIPVIILSGLADTALSLKAISMGAQDFLLKGSYDKQALEKSVWYSIERKKNLELLKENNERYDIISKATNDIIWDWDLLKDKVNWVGQGLKNYLPENFSGEDIPTDFWVRGLHPDERKNVVDGIYGAVANGDNSWACDYRFLRTDGMYAHINSRGYVIKNEDQKPLRMIGSMQDITDRKTAEIETQKARIDAEEARKTQEQFLANISHEIRTPMNGVIGMTQLLAGTTLNEDQKEYVETIQESATNLMVIINDILDLTKIVAGKINIIQADYILSDIVNSSVKINQYKADEKGIAVKVHIDENIHPVLCGDPGRLSQILINLVGNAIKFTDEGEVGVKVDMLGEDEGYVTLEFSVTDTGIGIAEDKIESVFDRFMQVSGASTRKYGGTGLGLTITRQLVELQGGTIQVKSQQGKGSVFTFYLTIRKGKLNNSNQKKPIQDTQYYSLDGVKVLLVEDNFINQKVGKKTLTNMGAVVDIANNGREAIGLLEPKRYDIILMDIQMPEMDGYEATRIIRTEMCSEITNTPIIAMTASALITDREKCLVAGMSDYIAKPFKPEELYEKIMGQLLG